VTDAQKLAEAIEEAERLTPYRSWPPVRSFPTTLHSDYRPAEPPKPPTTGIVPAEPYEAPETVEDAAGSARGVTMQLDIRFLA
jgi:hypothetical protein